MQIAFYAPLKPVDHPVPSGDRMVARLLCAALQRAGYDVDIAARLRSRVADGNIMMQARLAELGGRLASRLLRQYERGFRPRPDIWFTYHLYYKAPDWIGPLIADHLGIPYVVAEASHAPKRANGPWRQSHAAIAHALSCADAVFSLNRADMECLAPLCAADRLHYLPPFLDLDGAGLGAGHGQRDEKQDEGQGGAATPVIRLITTAMMRHGDKLHSYRILAQALGQLKRAGRTDWHLEILGDGPARADVMACFADADVLPGRDGGQYHMAGQVDADGLARHLSGADLFVWPAVNEAFGMALLEAQAAGLPVLAGNVGGVPGIVDDGITGWLVPVGDADAFGGALAGVMDGGIARMRQFGRAGAQKAARHHSLDAASRFLARHLDALQGAA